MIVTLKIELVREDGKNLSREAVLQALVDRIVDPMLEVEDPNGDSVSIYAVEVEDVTDAGRRGKRTLETT